jgi:hypothetical protein
MNIRSSLEKILSKSKNFIGSALLAGALSYNTTDAAEITNLKVNTPTQPSVGTTNYYINTITNLDSTIETRLYKDDHHFMSVIEKNGCIAMRLAPGLDEDRWGSTFYPHAFLPGAQLKGINTKNVSLGSDRIQITLDGSVSKGTSDTFGNWHLDMYFQSANKSSVYGNGICSINLPAPLSTINADLNLLKIATSVLDEVPLLDGTTGRTGDTGTISARGWKSNNLSEYTDFIWDPVSQPGHFPQDLFQSLSITLPANYNNVDTLRQGYAPIKPAFKSSLSLLISSFGNSSFIFGGMYNTSESKNFWSDNVGITPLVLKNHPGTNIMYNIYINSVKHDQDSIQDLVTLNANGNTGTFAGVFYTPSLSHSFSRIGTIPFKNGEYKGTVKVSPEHFGFYDHKYEGYFQVKEE